MYPQINGMATPINRKSYPLKLSTPSKKMETDPKLVKSCPQKIKNLMLFRVDFHLFGVTRSNFWGIQPIGGKKIGGHFPYFWGHY